MGFQMNTLLYNRKIITVAFLGFCGVFLSIGLVLTGNAVQAQSSEPAYADLSEGSFYYEPVASLKEKGVFEGTDCEEGFCPEDPLERWQMAVWLIRILDDQEPEPVTESRFVDVDAEESWLPLSNACPILK